MVVHKKILSSKEIRQIEKYLLLFTFFIFIGLSYFLSDSYILYSGYCSQVGDTCEYSLKGCSCDGELVNVTIYFGSDDEVLILPIVDMSTPLVKWNVSPTEVVDLSG